MPGPDVICSTTCTALLHHIRESLGRSPVGAAFMNSHSSIRFTSTCAPACMRCSAGAVNNCLPMHGVAGQHALPVLMLLKACTRRSTDEHHSGQCMQPLNHFDAILNVARRSRLALLPHCGCQRSPESNAWLQHSANCRTQSDGSLTAGPRCHQGDTCNSQPCVICHHVLRARLYPTGSVLLCNHAISAFVAPSTAQLHLRP